MDKPETRLPRKPGEYFGKVDSQPTAILLKNQRNRMEIQPVPCSRDWSCRLLVYEFRKSDNQLANRGVIRQSKTSGPS